MHLFTYGTLMCPEIITRVIGFLPPHQPACLDNYRRGPLAGVDYPGIIPRSGGRVIGLLYLDLANGAWTLLDEFEDQIYRRCAVSVLVGNKRILAAETYVLKPEYESRLGSADWSYRDFLSSGKARFEKEYDYFPLPKQN